MKELNNPAPSSPTLLTVHLKSKTRLNACISGLNFLSDLAMEGEAEAHLLYHWLRPVA